MTVAGRLSVNGQIPERGVVDQGPQGDARAFLAGEPLELERERTRVRRASGVLFVTGSRVTVTVIGRGLSFSIAGHGRALFAGSGVYRLDSETEAEWSGEWVRIALLLPGEKESTSMRKLLLIGGASALIALPAVALAQTDEPVPRRIRPPRRSSARRPTRRSTRRGPAGSGTRAREA